MPGTSHSSPLHASFVRIIGEIPSYKLIETEQLFSFLDIGPLSKGHALIIPKCTYLVSFICCSNLMESGIDHGEKLHEIPDEYLAETLPVAKKIALALGAENYNILQVSSKLPLPYTML